MPLSYPPSHTSPDRLSGEVMRFACSTADEFVEKSVVEAGEKWRGEIVFGEEAMRNAFSYTNLVKPLPAGCGCFAHGLDR